MTLEGMVDGNGANRIALDDRMPAVMDLLVYLWTRDAEVPIEDVEEYVKERLPAPDTITEVSDVGRMLACRQAVSAWEERV